MIQHLIIAFNLEHTCDDVILACDADETVCRDSFVAAVNAKMARDYAANDAHSAANGLSAEFMLGEFNPLHTFEETVEFLTDGEVWDVRCKTISGSAILLPR